MGRTDERGGNGKGRGRRAASGIPCGRRGRAEARDEHQAPEGTPGRGPCRLQPGRADGRAGHGAQRRHHVPQHHAHGVRHAAGHHAQGGQAAQGRERGHRSLPGGSQPRLRAPAGGGVPCQGHPPLQGREEGGRQGDHRLHAREALEAARLRGKALQGIHRHGHGPRRRGGARQPGGRVHHHAGPAGPEPGGPLPPQGAHHPAGRGAAYGARGRGEAVGVPGRPVRAGCRAGHEPVHPHGQSLADSPALACGNAHEGAGLCQGA